jgi:hypothetical protein
MWQKFVRFGQYFYNIIMPARFRRASMERQVTRYMNRGVDKWQHPDQLAEMAASDASREAEKKARTAGAAEQARAEGQAETGQATPGEQPKASFATRFWQVMRWILHFVLVALILIGLYYLNRWLGIDKLLHSDWPVLHPYWLPMLFLIVYMLLWLGGWLWSLTGPSHVGDDYPDLNQAWDLAVATLHRSGIDIRQAPVFLVLGRTESPPNELFGVTLRLRVSAPQGDILPIRIYASQDRVFITCPGASVLARQARTLTKEALDEYESSLGDATAHGTPVEAAAGVGQVAQAGAAVAEAPAATNGGGVATETDAWTEEDQRVTALLESEGLGIGVRAKKSSASFLKDPVEVRLLTSRLKHLCRLIRRDRTPYAPVNGILVLVPYAALQDDLDASQTATACRTDLLMIRRELQVQCPTFALVCDMEKSDGFHQFLRRLPVRHNISRLGQRFPLYPDVDEREIPRLVESGTAWLANSLLPSLVYNLFRLEAPGGAATGREVTQDEALGENTKLYDFLWETREKRQRLARLLTRGLLMDIPRAFYFGGVYLAGTGQGMSAFTPGVFLRLLQSQNFLSWTPQALSAEHRYRWWAWFLFVVNLILIIGGPILAYIFWPR